MPQTVLQPFVSIVRRKEKNDLNRAAISPCVGKILSRDVQHTAAAIPTYTVELDHQTVKTGIPLGRILKYVTPDHLEAFEHDWFRADIARLREEAHAKRRRAANARKRAPVVKTRSVTPTSTQPSCESDDAEASANQPVETNSRGRPRPSYTHLYNVELQKRPAKVLKASGNVGKRPSKLMEISLPSPKRSPAMGEIVLRDADTPESDVRSVRSVQSIQSTQPLEHVQGDAARDDSISDSTDSMMEMDTETEPVPANVHSSPFRASGLFTIPDAPPPAEDGDDGTFAIEDILTHQLSDPRTHGPEHGEKPVMLYKVKWSGFEECTWEPEQSFEDDLLEEYWAEVRKKEMRRLGGKA